MILIVRKNWKIVGEYFLMCVYIIIFVGEVFDCYFYILWEKKGYWYKVFSLFGKFGFSSNK